MAFCLRNRHVAGLFRTFTTAVLSPESKTPLSARAKSRIARSLLKSENNPERVLEICRAAALSPDFHIDRAALSAAIFSLTKSNNYSYVKTFIDELRSTRPDLSNERFDAHAIVLYGQAKMVNHAVDLFKELHRSMDKGSVKCLNALIFACILSKDFKEMKRVYVEFPKLYNVEPDVETFNRVIKGFCEGGEANSSYSVLTDMERASVKPNASTFAEMLKGFYRERKFDDVNKVLQLMKQKYGINPGVPTHNVRIKSLCLLKRSKEAKKLLDEMLEKGIQPNFITYRELILGFCMEGDLEEAKTLFNNMLSRGLEANGDVYFSLAHFLCEAGDFETASRICQQSIEKGWVPNFTTMKALVKGLKSQGRVDEAKELIAEVKGKASRKLELWEEIEASIADA